MHKQTSSKETRRFFLEFHSLFVDRSAVSKTLFLSIFGPSPQILLRVYVLNFVSYFQNLKVQVPETVAAELGNVSISQPINPSVTLKKLHQHQILQNSKKERTPKESTVTITCIIT